jgi:hypothetical protein
MFRSVMFGCVLAVWTSVGAFAQTAAPIDAPDTRFGAGTDTAQRAHMFEGQSKKICGLVGIYSEPRAGQVPETNRLGLLELYDSGKKDGDRFFIVVMPSDGHNFPIVNNEGVFRGFANRVVCTQGIVQYGTFADNLERSYFAGIAYYIVAHRPSDIQVLPENAKAALPKPCNIVKLPGDQITFKNVLGGCPQ